MEYCSWAASRAAFGYILYVAHITASQILRAARP